MATINVLTSVRFGEKIVIAAYRSLAKARRSAEEIAEICGYEERVNLVWSDESGNSKYVIEQIELYN